MIHYIIQIVAFQLLFLVVYDLFLKKETFFNINRGYLIVTPLLSLVLPFIKIEKFKEAVPQGYVFDLSGIDEQIAISEASVGWMNQLSSIQWVLLLGSLVSLFLFIYKLLKIYQLKNKGEKVKHHHFTQVIIQKSAVAFSFFRNIFLGDEVFKKEHKHIIAHELVHINQKHSWDLIFYEILRIIFWFNPLIYIYQKRTTELHEFIADAHTVKTNKKEHYQHLLEEVFKTENISFINQFFNHSLIKKRIVMLQKSRSKKVWQLKYLLLVPVLAGMLFYTSCEKEVVIEVPNAVEKETEITGYGKVEAKNQDFLSRKEDVSLKVNDLDNLTEEEFKLRNKIMEGFENTNEALFLRMKDSYSNIVDIYFENGEMVKINTKKGDTTAKNTFKGINAPLQSIVVSPSFKTPCKTPGMNHSDCFKQKIEEHIINNFKYPAEAQEQNIQGRVYVNFKINTDGTVKVIETRAPDQLLEKEAIRIIESLPILNPGTDAKGNIVPVTFAYPIVFKLN